MIKRGILISLFTILLISVASAELMLSQPNSLYSMGDKFNITAKITSTAETSGFLTANLICDKNINSEENTSTAKEIELYKSFCFLSENEEKEFLISAKFDKSLISDGNTECYIKFKYNSQEASSYKFKVSKDIDISLTIDGAVFSPKEEVKVSGKAIKSNDEPLVGFIELSIPEINFEITELVKEGNFNLNFTIPSNARSGSLEIKAKAYEKDKSEQIINEGTETSSIKIRQIMKDLKIELNSNAIIPDSTLNYKVLLLDQADDIIEEDIKLKIYDANKALLKETLVRSGKELELFISQNSTPGYWKLGAEIKEFKTEKEFLVEELERASFVIENDTLLITNTGNIIYEKPIEITIAGVKEIQNIKLNIGETKKFKLSAPDGEYNIEILGGSQKHEFGGVSLTGDAISIEDLGNKFKRNWLLLLLAISILIVAGIIVFFVRRYIRQKKFGGAHSYKPLNINKISPPKSSAENIIDKGQKQHSSVISLKLKNFDKLEKTDLNAIDKALTKAKESGAKIYIDGDYRIIILAPILTKTENNNQKAINLAQHLEKSLISHKKIDFGIGINDGNLIIESRNGKFKFISLENTILKSKRISNHSNTEVLISESVHKSTAGKIRVTRLPNQPLWRVRNLHK